MSATLIFGQKNEDAIIQGFKKQLEDLVDKKLPKSLWVSEFHPSFPFVVEYRTNSPLGGNLRGSDPQNLTFEIEHYGQLIDDCVLQMKMPAVKTENSLIAGVDMSLTFAEDSTAGPDLIINDSNNFVVKTDSSFSSRIDVSGYNSETPIIIPMDLSASDVFENDIRTFFMSISGEFDLTFRRMVGTNNFFNIFNDTNVSGDISGEITGDLAGERENTTYQFVITPNDYGTYDLSLSTDISLSTNVVTLSNNNIDVCASLITRDPTVSQTNRVFNVLTGHYQDDIVIPFSIENSADLDGDNILGYAMNTSGTDNFNLSLKKIDNSNSSNDVTLFSDTSGTISGSILSSAYTNNATNTYQFVISPIINPNNLSNAYTKWQDENTANNDPYEREIFLPGASDIPTEFLPNAGII